MSKNSTIFFCSNCGNEFPKWSGQCQICKQWNTLTEATSFLKSKGSPKAKPSKAESLSVKEAQNSDSSLFFSTNISEMDRVLGKGIAKGGVYLLAGQPGIGKSTLLTTLAIKSKEPVYYVCSEENPSQVAVRINRLTPNNPSHITLLSTSSVDEISQIISQNPKALYIVDSIQSVYTDTNATSPGSPSQVRDCASILIQSAKKFSAPVVIVGHVTKEGTIAGPKMLEHMVDTVLELSGDRQHLLRLLRTIKNRFGPTDETGIFQMTGKGLEEVPDPGALLLKDRIKNAPGSCITMVMEGTRPLTVEIQALVSPTPLPIPRRIAKGISTNRLQLICAILSKHLRLPISDKDVYVNVTGGMEIKDPGADLGIALAIISSAKNISLPSHSICFGELGLLGEVRNVSFSDKITKEAKALGYHPIYSNETLPSIKSLKLKV